MNLPTIRPFLCLVTLCAALALPHLTAAADGDDLRALVGRLQPDSGWSANRPARVAVGDELFDLIDGGAELYHEYGFKQAASWQLEDAGRASIQVEIYEMADAPAAYGVFSLMQSGKYTRGELGQGSLRFGYYLAFWSGPYYASVTGSNSTAAVQAEVDNLAKQLAVLLPADGVLPAWFAHLPTDGQQERKYFRDRIALSNIDTGPAGDLVAGGEGLTASYSGVQVVLFHFATEAAATTELARAAQTAPNDFVADGAGFVVAKEGAPRLVVQKRSEDLIVFTIADEAQYRALATTLGLAPL